MENKKVFCPWCGAEMELEIYENNEYSSAYAYVCGECTATAPAGLTEEEALEKAMRYFKPLQKPLTLEEVLNHPDVLCVETHTDGKMTFGVLVGDYYEMQDGTVFPVTADDLEEMVEDGLVYGRNYRCWATKPTDEEREAAKWET